jgi:hypothetical protein
MVCYPLIFDPFALHSRFFRSLFSPCWGRILHEILSGDNSESEPCPRLDLLGKEAQGLYRLRKKSLNEGHGFSRAVNV